MKMVRIPTGTKIYCDFLYSKEKMTITTSIDNMFKVYHVDDAPKGDNEVGVWVFYPSTMTVTHKDYLGTLTIKLHENG